MATSVASQLVAIKSATSGAEDPFRRPITRPSILFDPKEAADIDLQAIFALAVPGLEVLTKLDPRFRRYNDTLFCRTSLELEREKMVAKEEEKLNASIHSYLRLLAGNLQHPAALKTLEYLIRRYKVHLFNVDELILCSLPYHDTHVCVRIIQLVDLGNKQWAFLEGVKVSGAPPPRKVIVQQCVVDKGVLEAICNYASPTKDFQHSRPVTCFCTAVIVETLGSISRLDTDTVNRTLNFVFNGLNPDKNPTRDHKAGALMTVGLLATRATLKSKLVHNFISLTARLAKKDAEHSSDLPWLRVIVIAIVSLVQAQPLQILPKSTVIGLIQIRDFNVALFGLSKEFNVHKFMEIYLESLVECSILDESCRCALVEALEMFPLVGFVEKIVLKVLSTCLKFTLNKSNTDKSGGWAKAIFSVLDTHCHREICAAVRKFLENHMNSKDGGLDVDTFCCMFDGHLNIPLESSDSRILFLEHPKAEFRKATLRGIATSGNLKSMASTPQKLMNIQGAIVRCLHDNDMNVVQAAMSIDLSGVVDPLSLLEAYRDVLTRSIGILNQCSSETSKAAAIAISCLEHLALVLESHNFGYSEEVATIFFPLLLIHQKTLSVNMKALELVKKLRWTFFLTCSIAYESISFERIKALELDYVASINTRTVNELAENFILKPQEHIEWLVKCGSNSNSSKTLLLLIMLKALIIHNEETCSFSTIYQACFPVLKQEWLDMGIHANVVVQKIKIDKLDDVFGELVNQLFGTATEKSNATISIIIFWSLLKAYDVASKNKSCAKGSKKKSSETATHHPLGYGDDAIFHGMFLFFIKSKQVFSDHLNFLFKSCGREAFQFLSKYFVNEGFPEEVQAESLLSVSALYAMDWSLANENSHLQLLREFISLLVPVSNENKDIRVAAIGCIEDLFKIWHSFSSSRLRNGDHTPLARCMHTSFFGGLLEVIVGQKRLIISDENYLPSLLASLFTASASLLVPETPIKRFESSEKDETLNLILSSTLKFHSPYGKFMVLSLFREVGNAILLADGMESLLVELMERRNTCHADNATSRLSKVEIDTLCLLLEACVSVPKTGQVKDEVLDYALKSLEVDGLPSENDAVIRTVSFVMQNLTALFYSCLKTDQQLLLVGHLVFLLRNESGVIRAAAGKALLELNVDSYSLVKLLELTIAQDLHTKKRKIKNLVGHQIFGVSRDSYNSTHTKLSLLSSLLDTLLLKKSIDDRITLIQCLFDVLEKLFSDDWLQSLISVSEEGNENINEHSENIVHVFYQVQQTAVITLKGFFDSDFQAHPHKDELLSKSNMSLLINCIQSATDATTRNYLFMLLASISKVTQLWLSEHIVDVFTLLGESAAKQSDGHSERVVEDLISTLVPCWLSKAKNTVTLLQIFIKSLPNIAEHKRLSLIVYLLRTLGDSSLGEFIFHLFGSMIQRLYDASFKTERNVTDLLSSGSFATEWEYVFVLQICDQYSCRVWLPCLAKILESIKEPLDKQEHYALVYLSLRLIESKFQDPELVFQINTERDADHLQVTLGTLTERIVFQTYGITKNANRELKACVRRVLKSIISWVVPSNFFSIVSHLLGSQEIGLKKETLGLLCEFVKVNTSALKVKKMIRKHAVSFIVDKISLPSFHEMCLKIVHLVKDFESRVILDAISTIETLTKVTCSDDSIFMSFLDCAMKHIRSDNSISTRSLSSVSALIGILGIKALPHLPYIMTNIREKAHEIFNCPEKTGSGGSELLEVLSTSDASILSAIFATLTAVIENLGGFLNPYLDDILDLIVLHPECALEAYQKLTVNLASIRKLVVEKIPARLMLSPLLNIFSRTVKNGDFSISANFEMLADLINTMDKSLIASYHVKIYKHCLSALELRSQSVEAVKSINVVEDSVIHTIIVLTMKLTESTFRPLFFHTLKWVEPEIEEISSKAEGLVRIISFYRLVNKLIEHHRSLFVPYFKDLIEGYKRYLMEDHDAASGSIHKSKKIKIGDVKSQKKARALLSLPELWHVKALIVKSLYKCFLYDTSELKLLGLSNFEDLMKPIVCQFAVDPPQMLELPDDVPNVEEVDESLVLCLGQMAIAARSDVMWKSLNREVLLQTRSEKLRPKFLGLRVVRYLVEHLKEEYLVLMAETIPFLAELLEDADASVKSLAQEIIREMEALSGESLRQYL